MEFEQKIAQAEKERNFKTRSTKVKLGMFEPDALESGQLSEMVDVFFGVKASWLAANTDPKSKKISTHEDRVKQRYKKKHPGTTDDEYSQIRSEQLVVLKKRARVGINTRFENAVAERFDVPRDAGDFAKKRLLDGGAVMQQVANTLYPENRSLHPRNEVVLLPLSPANVVELVASSDTDPALKREEIIRHLHSFVAAEHKRTNGKLESEKKIAQIQALFAAELFERPQGSVDEMSIRAVFDNMTTEIEFVNGIDGDIKDYYISEGKHIKTMPIAMRRVKGSGILISTSPDTKTIESAEAKSISRAKERKLKEVGDEVVPSDVHDTHRILFTVYGDDAKRDEFVSQVQELLKDSRSQRVLGDQSIADEPRIDENGQIKGRVLSVEDDSSTNGYKTQAKVKFRRIQVHFDGLHAPVEIKIQTVQAKLEDDLSVGEINPETGFYDGPAHALYEIRRASFVSEFYSPEEIRGLNHDLKAEVMKTQGNVVYQLRNRAR
jgi:hypothetical protein